MSRLSPLALAAALLAGIAGYGLGSGAAPARAEQRYEYKVLTIIEFDVQGDKMPGDEWVKPSHLDLPHKKIGDALLKEKAIMTRVLNNVAAEGWEPVMVYLNSIVVRRPQAK